MRIYAMIYSIFFLSNTFVSVDAHACSACTWPMKSTSHCSRVTAVCVVAWLILLTPQGAEVPCRSDDSWVRNTKTACSRQLDSLNAALLKVGRRATPQVISQKVNTISLLI